HGSRVTGHGSRVIARYNATKTAQSVEVTHALASGALLCATMLFSAPVMSARAAENTIPPQSTKKITHTKDIRTQDQVSPGLLPGKSVKQKSIQNPHKNENILVVGHSTDSAIYQAPSKAPLEAFQPTSLISQHFIENNIPPTGNYDTVAILTPSVMSISPNGPGLSEAGNMSIRGFQDGEYNVTFDGIPFADGNNFTHHSTGYFMSHSLGDTSVDRGPGDASTLGYATFGGTISVKGKDPKAQRSVETFGSMGAWNTYTYGGEINSGKMKKLNGASFVFDGTGSSSDGYLTYSGQQRWNLYSKGIQPIGEHTTLTFMGLYNNLNHNTTLGATREEIAKYGPNYGLSNNPNSQNYYKYNTDAIQTDMAYVALHSDLGNNWTIDNKVYTYAYYHHGHNTNDVNGTISAQYNTTAARAGVTCGAKYKGTIYESGPGCEFGQAMRQDYRAWGDVFALKRDFGLAKLDVGFWLEHQTDTRQQGNFNYAVGKFTNTPNLNRLMTLENFSAQPYVQLTFRPLPNLTVSPGFKYALMDRQINAPINQKTGTPLNYDQTYGTPMPSLNVHYMAAKNWSAYLQVARGFLAPDAAYFYTPDPSANKVSPENTMNYQIGTSWQSRRFTVSADVYYIDFSNFVTSSNQNIPGYGPMKVYYNQGGVNYYGIEGEASYYVGGGVTLFANGSLNQSKTQNTGAPLAEAPDATAAGGIIYEHNGFYASVIDKWIGARAGQISSKGIAEKGLDPFNQLNLSVSYTFQQHSHGIPPIKLGLHVTNLANSTKIVDYAGSTADGNDLWISQAGRGFFGSVSVPLGF
ncbi:TonB-dependent receptor, partial [Acidomonas methanolica]|uniref:TonB-dependent receptor n=3 Tax=Acidomonas methanolica TaxID=437 RepID=UPI001955477C